jgi:putative acetyltransferase
VRSRRHRAETPARHTDAVHITRADFSDPRLAAFLQAHLDDMEPTAPPESRHALDLTALQGDGVRLWVGRPGGDRDGILGTVALAAVDDGHEELKSMRTEPRVRGTGVATSLLAHALDDARRRGVSRVSLETGSMEFFEPARRFYSRAGFTPCEPFGSYVEDPLSSFMTLELGPR